MRPIRTISVFPTLLTLGNLICGFFAIVVAARIVKPIEPINLTQLAEDAEHLMTSGWLIFLAMVFDGLDGYVAGWLAPQATSGPSWIASATWSASASRQHF